MVATENIVDTGSPSTDPLILQARAICEAARVLPEQLSPPVPTAPHPASFPARFDFLHHVVTCRIPTVACSQLQAGPSFQTAASEALGAGIVRVTEAPPERAPLLHLACQPRAVVLSALELGAVGEVAAAYFEGDVRWCAGWLIARGLGLMLPAGMLLPDGAAPAQTPTAVLPVAVRRSAAPAVRQPRERPMLPPDDSAPSGGELRRMREAAGLSQRDLAEYVPFSRGLIAEIECGRRRNVLTRLRLAEALRAPELQAWVTQRAAAQREDAYRRKITSGTAASDRIAHYVRCDLAGMAGGR